MCFTSGNLSHVYDVGSSTETSWPLAILANEVLISEDKLKCFSHFVLILFVYSGRVFGT